MAAKAVVGSGKQVDFSDDWLSGVKVIPTQHPSDLRQNFTKKLFNTPCGPNKFPAFSGRTLPNAGDGNNVG